MKPVLTPVTSNVEPGQIPCKLSGICDESYMKNLVTLGTHLSICAGITWYTYTSTTIPKQWTLIYKPAVWLTHHFHNPNAMQPQINDLGFGAQWPPTGDLGWRPGYQVCVRGPGLGGE